MPYKSSRLNQILHIGSIVLMAVLLWVQLAFAPPPTVAPSATFEIPSGVVTVPKFPHETRGEWAARSRLLVAEIEGIE